jgi:lycopene cyclase domain-containing protein
VPRSIYLLLDLGTLLFPLLLSFDRKVAFHRHWPRLFAGIGLIGGGFVIWDILFTRAGVWSFNPQYLIGPAAFGLPLEEYLFFLVVPYACVFIYACLLAYFPPWHRKDKGLNVLPVLGVVLLMISVIFRDRAYTFWACGLCGLLCLGIVAFRHRLTHFRADLFLVAWAICLLPFFLVNGVLTALPVVLYNDAENTGLRLFTIPAEDTFYGMLLVMGCALFLKRTHPR